MGMESFFVILLPENMEFCFPDNIRRVCGNSSAFEIDWEAVLSVRKFYVYKNESYLILDNCIEMEIVRNREGSAYIVLRGCFSCFSQSIEKMCCLIDYISSLVNKEIRIDILGESVKWENSNINKTIFNSYMEKYNSFKSSFGDINLLVPPSRFYKEYEKQKNPMKRLIAKIFK